MIWVRIPISPDFEVRSDRGANIGEENYRNAIRCPQIILSCIILPSCAPVELKDKVIPPRDSFEARAGKAAAKLSR